MRYLNGHLDDRDRAILAERQAAFLARDYLGPFVGDVVRFADGPQRRISYVWPEGVQTTDGGSFYLGTGYMSYSGSLYLPVPTDTLTLAEADGLRVLYAMPAWFFHHDWQQAHNGVHVLVDVLAWDCSAPSPTI